MTPLNQEVYCEQNDVIMTLVFPSFETDQVMLELWLISFSPLPWHGFGW